MGPIIVFTIEKLTQALVGSLIRNVAGCHLHVVSPQAEMAKVKTRIIHTAPNLVQNDYQCMLKNHSRQA